MDGARLLFGPRPFGQGDGPETGSSHVTVEERATSCTTPIPGLFRADTARVLLLVSRMLRNPRQFTTRILASHGNAIRLVGFGCITLVVVACSGAIDTSSSGASRQGATAGEADQPGASAAASDGACTPVAVCTYIDHIAPDGGGGPGGAIQPKTDCRTQHTSPSLWCEWIEGESSMQCRCAANENDIPDAADPSPATLVNVSQATAPDAQRTLDLWKQHCAGACVP